MVIHPSVGRVSSVRAIIKRKGGPYAHFNCDLVWIQGIPTVVIEWASEPEGDVPLVTIPLDAQKLRKLGWKEAEYLYDEAIQDPRALD